ncbi:MAG: MoxR family ATPase [Actinomycetia bacterium]|nr:MoxR family ATPase [Actinomycetes bacterium]
MTQAAITAAEFSARFERMVTNIGTVIKGKDDVVRLCLIGMLAEGHVLFEDLPGTGKTILSRAISQTISAQTSRIQCTPDLLPADVTGSSVVDRATGEFEFRPGPVFTNVLLADEINRATPKTQSALLEAMAEGKVTYDGVTRELPKPFFVLATMNPLEFAGTFPLPEAQLDRFMFKLSVGYADRSAEAEVLRANAIEHAIESIEAVLTIEEFAEMITFCQHVSISDDVLMYIVDLVQESRVDPAVDMGASTRASTALLRGARVMAASQGRGDVLPEDVKQLVRPLLSHRLVLTPDAQLMDEHVEGVVDRLLHRVKVPMSGFTEAAAVRTESEVTA